VADLVFGIETEYGVLGPSNNSVLLSSWVVAAYKATQDGRVAPWDFRAEDPLNDARGFRLDRAAAHPSLLTDRPGAVQSGQEGQPGRASRVGQPFRDDAVRLGPGGALLVNGARLYVDHAHPEYATPETATAREAALWDRAGQMIMAAAAATLAETGRPVRLYKNNTDGQGASYGTHENYLVPRRSQWDQLVAGLTPFLVTRQIFTGSGRVGLGQRSQRAGFQLSQRADFIEAETGLETTLNRPIVNTRDEPHADPSRWRRLHIIAGDATMMDSATYVRLGVTGLVLRALASNGDPTELITGTTLVSPVTAFQEVSRDLDLMNKLPLKNGGQARAVDLQRRYRDFVATRLKRWLGATDPNHARLEALDLLERWSNLLDNLENDPSEAAGQVEWLAKYRLLDSLRMRHQLDWSAAKLRAADIKWTAVDPATSLFSRVEATGAVERLFSDTEVAWAVDHPPESTRAYVKGETLRRFPQAVTAANWDSLTLAWAGGSATIGLSDPLAGRRSQASQLLEAATSAPALAAGLAAKLEDWGSPGGSGR
jgi:proteasome accessory factor A